MSVKVISGKCLITVQAGIILNIPIPELSRTFNYTSEDYEADMENKEDADSRFNKICGEAYDYARSISCPTEHNWVTTNWIWL